MTVTLDWLHEALALPLLDNLTKPELSQGIESERQRCQQWRHMGFGKSSALTTTQVKQNKNNVALYFISVMLRLLFFMLLYSADIHPPSPIELCGC